MLKRILHNYKVSFSGLSRETWLLSLVILINRCGYMAVPFMSMYITQSLHRSIADAGLIITLFGVGSVAGATAGGFLTDKICFRPVQIFSLIISGGLFVLYGEFTDFTHVCLLTIALSFFVESFKPANTTAIAAYSSRENLTRSYSLNRLATNLGFGFGTSVGGILAAIDYHLLFRVDGIVYAAAGLLIWFLLPKESRVVHQELADSASPSQSPWKDGFFVRFMILVTAFTMTFLVLFRLAPVFWKEQLHINETQIGLLMGMNGIIIAVFEMVLIQSMSNRTDSWLIRAGITFTGLSFLVLMVAEAMPIVLAAIAIILFTIGEMLTLPYMTTIVMNRSNESNRGQYSAAYAISWAVAQIVGPSLGGLVAEKGGYEMLWLSMVILCLVCALGFKLIFRREVALS